MRQIAPEAVFVDNIKRKLRGFLVTNRNFDGYYRDKPHELIRACREFGSYMLEEIDSTTHLVVPEKKPTRKRVRR